MKTKLPAVIDINGLEIQAAESLSLFLSGDTSDEKLIPGARIAATVFSACQRRRQTEGARDALNFMMARELSDNRKELQIAINKALPDSVFVKKLE